MQWKEVLFGTRSALGPEDMYSACWPLDFFTWKGGKKEFVSCSVLRSVQAVSQPHTSSSGAIYPHLTGEKVEAEKSSEIPYPW